MKAVRDFAVYGIIVAGILVVMRPKSQGAAFVQAIGKTAVGFVQAITGQKVSVNLTAAG